MFCVNIALGSTSWRLLYREEEKAKAVFESLKVFPIGPKNVTVEDDFGQLCSATLASIHGLMFEDLDKAKMANVELFLHQQRVQAMATKAAQSDPGLRASSMMNGPAMLNPMGGMPRN